jgi:hypothetical protein
MKALHWLTLFLVVCLAVSHGNAAEDEEANEIPSRAVFEVREKV